ncbi:hypothetical protein MJD09_04325 [bacterium]|nr:hypothetical protein [bacterium]
MVTKYSRLREQITIRQMARDLEKLKKVKGARSSEVCATEARKLMSRISAAKRTFEGHSELTRFEHRLQKFVNGNSQRDDMLPVSGTTEQAKKTNRASKHYGRGGGLHGPWRQVLRSFGISEKDFEDMRRSLASIDGCEPKDLDTIWELLNTLERQESQAQKPNFRLLRMIYYSMAILAYETGRPYLELLIESNRMLLLYYKQSRNVKHVQLLTVSRDDCQACQKYDRKIITLERALKRMPIPCLSCPFNTGKSGEPSFTCTYVASQNSS